MRPERLNVSINLEDLQTKLTESELATNEPTAELITTFNDLSTKRVSYENRRYARI